RPRPNQERSMAKPARVVVSKDGPYMVTGGPPLSRQTIVTDAEGGSERWEEGEPFPVRQTYPLCRCGHSNTKPFCDGTHGTVGFDGTETAGREPYLKQAKLLEGPVLSLSDAEGLCAFGRFCDPHGSVWNEVAHTDEPTTRERFLRRCNVARLAAWS